MTLNRLFLLKCPVAELEYKDTLLVITKAWLVFFFCHQGWQNQYLGLEGNVGQLLSLEHHLKTYLFVGLSFLILKLSLMI